MWIFRSIHFRATVRIVAVVLALAGLLVLPGCWVQSIHGLSESGWFNSDKDQVSDPVLLGTWAITLDKCAITLSVTAEDKGYSWQTTGVGEGCDKDSADYYEAQLFKLDDHQFLDLTARPADVCGTCRAIHWIFLIQIEKDSFTLTPIDSDWLKNAEEEKTVTLATLQGDTDTITASPKELKTFCRKYADDKEAFKPIPGFTFKRR